MFQRLVVQPVKAKTTAVINEQDIVQFARFMEKNQDVVALFLMKEITSSLSKIKSNPTKEVLSASPTSAQTENTMQEEYKAKLSEMPSKVTIAPAPVVVLTSKILQKVNLPELMEAVAAPWRTWIKPPAEAASPTA
jgi:uncharacterized protein YqfA (UPF0365 family)